MSCLPFSTLGIPGRHTALLQKLGKPPSRLLNLHDARLGSLCISTPHVSHSRLHGDHSSRVYDTRHAAEPHESPTPLLLLWALLREGWLVGKVYGHPCRLATFGSRLSGRRLDMVSAHVLSVRPSTAMSVATPRAVFD